MRASGTRQGMTFVAQRDGILMANMKFWHVAIVAAGARSVALAYLMVNIIMAALAVQGVVPGKHAAAPDNIFFILPARSMTGYI